MLLSKAYIGTGDVRELVAYLPSLETTARATKQDSTRTQPTERRTQLHVYQSSNRTHPAEHSTYTYTIYLLPQAYTSMKSHGTQYIFIPRSNIRTQPTGLSIFMINSTQGHSTLDTGHTLPSVQLCTQTLGNIIIMTWKGTKKYHLFLIITFHCFLK